MRKSNLGSFKKGHAINLGRKRAPFSSETRIKMGKSKEGEKNVNWKGEDAGYNSKHTWVSGHFGKPTTCEFCNKKNLTGHQIHWANVSGMYRRLREDWVRLCVKCHWVFDGRRIINKKYG